MRVGGKLVLIIVSSLGTVERPRLSVECKPEGRAQKSFSSF
jgi:hypothetical protein